MMNESRYDQVLTCIAAGMTVEQTRVATYGGPELTEDELTKILRDAISSGIEPEDIAPSWRDLGGPA